MSDFPNAVVADSHDSNAILVERFRNHDPSAMTTLVTRYYERVFATCFRILGHRQDAEDATQETFSRFAKYFDRWDPHRPLGPWLIAIAGNRCRTQLARRRNFAPLQASPEPVTQDLTQRQAADALREEVSLILITLPDNQRTAFKLFHEQSLSYNEIAERLKCPVGTVKTWVHRARTSLIQQLQRREVVHIADGEYSVSHSGGAG